MQKAVRKGDRGTEVEQLQALLNKHLKPSPGLKTDGAFGHLTEKAVRKYQALVGLGIDGVVGNQTWGALESGQTQDRTRITMPVGAAPWMAVAMREMGQSEIAGTEHNPRIIEYHATTTLRATTDETAWCASFVNWCLQEAGVAGSNSAAAASWLRWGVAGPATPGAITVIYNAAAAASLSISGNHVGFLVQASASHYKLLGGNQSNRVRVSSFPKAAWTLKGYRWPEGTASAGRRR